MNENQKKIYSLEEDISSLPVGGKANNLSLMLRFGLPIPKGYVVISCSDSIDELQSELKDVLSDLSSKIMVRSSAIGEDGVDHSFAGQLDSFISNNNLNDVSDAITKCWASMTNLRSSVYSDYQNVKLSQMGVVLQDLVEPDYAGVYFTHSPQDSNKRLLEYVEGHAEKLVSGEVTPVTLEFSENLPETPFPIEQLFNLSLKVLDYYRTPQDIEWVSKDGKVSLVQSRPITFLKTKVYWSNTNVNENYPDEMSPFLFSIAKQSYYHYFRNIGLKLKIINDENPLTQSSLNNTVGLWGNKLYYNMSNIHTLLSMSPFSSLFKKSFDHFVGYQHSEAGSDNGSLKNKLITSLLLLTNYFKLPSRVSMIEDQVDSYCSRVNDLTKVNRIEFSHLYHKFLDIRFNRWVSASYADLYAMVTHGALGKLCTLIDAEKSSGIQNGLLQAIPNLISNKPIFEMYDINQEIEKSTHDKNVFSTNDPNDVLSQVTESLRDRINQFLVDWGYRCSGELTFLSKNYCEDPASFIKIIQTYRKTNPVDPRIKFQEKEEEQKNLVKKVAKDATHLDLKKSLLVKLLLKPLVKATCYSISCRERVRLKQAKLYYGVKQVLIQFAQILVEEKQIDNVNDIFFLQYNELSALLSGDQSTSLRLRDIIEMRKKGFGSHESYPSNFYTHMEDTTQKAHTTQVIHKDGVFKGLAACGGEIKNNIKILNDMHEIDKLNPGDILVTKQTDPGWICAFPIIGGLIVENGGMLSHGAIVAREFGIPAVVGIAGITELLVDGEMVHLNGDMGTVEVLNK